MLRIHATYPATFHVCPVCLSAQCYTTYSFYGSIQVRTIYMQLGISHSRKRYRQVITGQILYFQTSYSFYLKIYITQLHRFLAIEGTYPTETDFLQRRSRQVNLHSLLLIPGRNFGFATSSCFPSTVIEYLSDCTKKI